MRPLLRAPLLGFGVGAIAGGVEACQNAWNLSLQPSFGAALVLGLITVLLNALFAALLSVPVGAIAERLDREHYRKLAFCITGSTLLVAAWFLGAAARVLWSQDRPAAAFAFGLAPIGAAGVVWFNAHYWLRREDFGEEFRFGWRRISLGLGLLLAVLSAFILSGKGAEKSSSDAPDILLLSIDTLRRDHVSAYGQSPVQTPNLDAMAARGVRFDDAISPLPETAPAHAAMMTGRHPARDGVLSNGHSLAPAYNTVAEQLEARGYARGAFVSSFALDARVGLNQGFEVYDDDFLPGPRGLSRVQLVNVALRLFMRFGDPARLERLYERPGDATVARALDWAGQKTEAPIFLWVHLFEPHAPYLPHGLPGFEDNGTPSSPSLDHRAILPKEPGYAWTDAERARARRLYQEEVAQADAIAGRLIAGLAGRSRPLAIVFTGDHGELLGEHGVDFHHLGLWEPAVRVPLIVVPPTMDKVKLREVSAQVRLMDVASTLLDLAGVKQAAGSEGSSLLLYAEGELEKGPGTLLIGRHPDRSGLIFGYRSGEVAVLWDPVADWQGVYDLATDPGESTDLSASQPQVAQAARDAITREAGALLNASSKADIDASTRNMLRALGYQE